MPEADISIWFQSPNFLGHC